jgi:hypothetical protein
MTCGLIWVTRARDASNVTNVERAAGVGPWLVRLPSRQTPRLPVL